jgi:protein-tyrosine phosphatase
MPCRCEAEHGADYLSSLAFAAQLRARPHVTAFHRRRLLRPQVMECHFPGFPSPPLGLLIKIVTSIENWLAADPANVAVIHCMTGKGRTAIVAACALAWLGEFDNAVSALRGTVLAS